MNVLLSPRTQRGPRGKRVLRGEAESKARALSLRARQPEAACANYVQAQPGAACANCVQAQPGAACAKCAQAQPGVTKLLYKKGKIG